MARDSLFRAFDPERTILHWHYVRRGELKHIIAHQSTADFHLNGALPYELPMLKLHLFHHLPAFLDKWRGDEKRLDGYIRARRVHDLLTAIDDVEDESLVPATSLLRESSPVPSPPKFTRREAIGAGGAVLLAGGALVGLRQWSRHERGRRAQVAILRARDYHADLAGIILEGFRELGVSGAEIKRKRVLLKPNLVETALGWAHINTNPAMVVAAAEVFLKLGAAEVIVAEGQGHRRDSKLVLDESGMGHALRQDRLRFVDLNHDEVVGVANRGNMTELHELYLPKTLLEADLVVSMPKVKTHHWAGMTCSMKNLFGVMPGIVYGWPKNVLHHEGIPESIFDINATVKPAMTIADGIVGMEGDGPIMGTPKQLGCVLVGRNSAAVDATAARLMCLNPYGIPHLSAASGKLGPIHEHNIHQRGERIKDLATPFAVLDVPHLKGVAKA